MPDINLDAIVTQSLIETGAPVAQIIARDPRAARLVITSARPRRVRSKSFDWTPDEDQIVRDNYTNLTDAEIGALLGRSEHGVHIRRERHLRLPARSKQPDELTANQISEGLGVDVHTVMAWIDRGLLPGRRLNLGDVYRVVKRVTLLRWIVNWRNWVYFDPDRVGKFKPQRTKHKYDAAFWQHARRLVERARSRWTDEWWTPGQVADHHNVSIATINNAVHDGRLPSAVKWKNWRILKSVAVNATHLHTGSGSNHYLDWSAGLDELIVLGTAIGLSVNALAAYAGAQSGTICYRRDELQRKKLIAPLIKSRGLAVEYKRGVLFADWKQYRKRFKALAAAMEKFRRSDDLTTRELTYVRGVLHAWTDRFYHARDRADLLRSLSTLGRKSAKHFRHDLKQLQRAGIDPDKRVTA